MLTLHLVTLEAKSATALKMAVLRQIMWQIVSDISTSRDK